MEFFQELASGVLMLIYLVLFVGASFLFSASIFAAVIFFVRYKKREKKAVDSVSLELRLPKDNEIKIDGAEQLFSSFSWLKKSGRFALLDVDDTLGFEIIAKHAEIKFIITTPKKLQDLVEKQIYAYYPTADIQVIEEPNIFSAQGKVAYASLHTKHANYQPIKTYKELATDSISSITSAMSKMGEGEGAMFQMLIRGADSSWKKAGKGYISKTKKDESNPEKATFKVDQKTLEKIDEKVTKSGYETVIRIVISSGTKEEAEAHLKNIQSSLAPLTSDLNNFTKAKIALHYGFMLNCIYKYFPLFELPFWRSISVLSSDELSTIYHFPNKTIETPHIKWLQSKSAPIAAEVPQEGGTEIGFGYHRGVKRKVNVLLEDRRRHVYIIGKTGMGKSELLKEMIKQDIREGKGVCVIDPHGDLVEDALRFIPPERAEDVIYFDPSDTERPMGLNLLEAYTEEQKHFMTTAIINLMYKLYDPQRTGIIGPRFEHAVRNAMLTVMSEPGSTFIEIVRVLTDAKYVQELLPKIQDPIVKRYWTDQIAQTSDFHKSEVLDYIVSKFGRFVTNKTMRNIIGQSKSAFDFRKVMDEWKILLINLSKGRLGEENSNFLGLVLIPKILVAAMSRQEIPEEDRRDFFLYVDEFQNFATPDFATILSEARKYRLGLTVANQFIGQMDEEIKNAIFGNVGTIISFRVGVTDASYLAREFQPVFSEADLINVDRFHAFMRTSVRNAPIPPFSVDLTKDMAEIKAQSNEKIAKTIIQLSRLKYGRARETIESEVIQRARL